MRLCFSYQCSFFKRLFWRESALAGRGAQGEGEGKQILWLSEESHMGHGAQSQNSEIMTRALTKNGALN